VAVAGRLVAEGGGGGCRLDGGRDGVAGYVDQ